MRKGFSLILFSAFLVSSISAQDYTPFIFPNAKWNIHGLSCDLSGSPIQGFHSFGSYWTGSDTLINGVSYYELFMRSSQAQAYICNSLETSFLSFNTGNPYLVGYLRQDTNARMVFYLPKDSLSEMTLYNFNLSLGDTSLSVALGFSGVITVSTVDSFQSGGVYYRRFNFQLFDTTWNMTFPAGSWIEGFGSTAGLLRPFFPEYPVPGRIWLECFSQNGLRIYPNYSMGGCVEVTSIEEDKLEVNVGVRIFPIPVISSFSLQLFSFPESQTCFHLFDALGRQVMQELITSATTNIHCGSLPNGIYFWQLQAENKILQRGKLLFE